MKRGPWVGFNWRYDSGLVAGNMPCYGVSAYNDCPQSTTLNGLPAIAMQDVVGNPLSADVRFVQNGPSIDGWTPPPPEYKHPKKNWRLKRGATPQWYKQRNGVRTRSQSGAARVARFRPPRTSV